MKTSPEFLNPQTAVCPLMSKLTMADSFSSYSYLIKSIAPYIGLILAYLDFALWLKPFVNRYLLSVASYLKLHNPSHLYILHFLFVLQ